MIPKVDAGFRKRSCSNNNLERDDESKKSHHAPEGTVYSLCATRVYCATTPSGAVSSSKAAANRARVYSLLGLAKTSAAGPSSITLPLRMTMRRLDRAATTLRSWEMNR